MVQEKMEDVYKFIISNFSQHIIGNYITVFFFQLHAFQMYCDTFPIFHMRRESHLCELHILHCVSIEISAFSFEDFQLLASAVIFSLENTDNICKAS